jgi:hypothetical protein
VTSAEQEVALLTRTGTVCERMGEKERCNGHLKEYGLASRTPPVQIKPGNRLFRCQRCGQLYEGPPLAHLR